MGKTQGTGKNRDYTELYKELFNQTIGRPRPTTDDELVERINEYFDYCARSDYSPSFHAMIAYCGFGINEVTDICRNLLPGLGARTKDIFNRAAEIGTAINYIRLGDGAHKSAAGAIFESKQPFPGGGWQDTPKVAVITPDYLKGGSAPSDLAALRARYNVPGEQASKIIDVTPEE